MMMLLGCLVVCLLSLVQMACVLIQVVGILKVFVAGISQQVTLVGDQLLLQSQHVTLMEF